FFFSSRRRHTRSDRDWSSDVCSSDLALYRDELASLEPSAGLHVAWTFTRTPPPGWTGWARRVDAAMLAELGPGPDAGARSFVCRSEERRVGKECRSRRWRMA